jgi:hypothetical protein
MENKAVVLWLLLLMASAAAAQDASAPAATLQSSGAPGEVSEDRSVQLHYNLRQQPLVRLEKAYALPVFCVKNTLTDPDPIIPKPLSPSSTCPDTSPKKARHTPLSKKVLRKTPDKDLSSDELTHVVLLPTKNADDIVKALQTGTEFVVSKADDTHLGIFCKARNCDAASIRAAYQRFKDAVKELARPAYVRYAEMTIPDKDTAKKLAKGIPTVLDGLSAELIDPTTIRIESNKRLNDYDVAALKDGIAKLQDRIAKNKPLPSPKGKTQAARIDLPQICVPVASLAKTFKALNEDDDCDAGYQKTQAANAPQIAAQLSAALGKTPDFTITADGNSVVIACNKGTCEGAAFNQLQASVPALARPAWPFSAEIDVAKETADWAAAFLTSDGVKATVLSGSRIRLTSDQPVSDDDLKTRLSALREHGFGEPYQPLVQRMFYQDAATVIADLLTTPLPQAPIPIGEQAPNTGPAAPASTTTTTSSPTGVTVNVTPAAPTPAPSTPAAPTTGPPPTGTLGQGMTSVGDNVVFTDTSQPKQIGQRIRLLTMLDLPRPEVLMNIWSLQASSPKGQEIETSLEKVRKAVEAHNEALQDAIDYGWAYLSRQMKDSEFFDENFSDYVTGRFVSDTPECEANPPDSRPAGCITEAQRERWGLCPAGTYCLGYTGLFNPIRPTLTSILLGMMAGKDSVKTVLTTIGCMEGKYEVYPECFPDRQDIEQFPGMGSTTGNLPARILADRTEYIDAKPPQRRLSCELLDEAALYAQQKEGLPVALPLSCFTIQAAKSFLPDHAFSTFSVEQLNHLSEIPIGAVEGLTRRDPAYQATSLGLLRSAVANFLFNYKMSQQFPQELSSYGLVHSAQELNALFNPLVVAFNEDVAIFSRTLMDRSQKDLPNQRSIFEIWRHNKNFVANGLITVRGISGIESLVDTDTQSSFDATQAQTLSQILGNLTGGQSNSSQSSSGGSQGAATSNSSQSAANTGTQSAGSPAATNAATPSPVAALPNTVLNGTLNPLTVATALAAITPTPTHSFIGRQLALDITPHTLPGASSAELDVKLWAQEDSPPTVYPAGSSNGQSDTVSRVARHNVATKVRVESVKLFDLSSFSAMIQRPRAKLPIVPPLIQLPLINGILSIPLPAAKLYYGSSAIVSAIIVPTASDLAYGIEFTADRAVFQDKTWRRFVQTRQLPDEVQIYGFHRMMSSCLATSAGKPDLPLCANTRFADLPRER